MKASEVCEVSEQNVHLASINYLKNFNQMFPTAK